MILTKNVFFGLLVLLSLVLVCGTPGLALEDVNSMACDNGPVNIGDKELTVFSNCGEPSRRNYEMHQWVYDSGPSEPVYVLTFDNGKVVKIQTDQWGS